MTRIHQYILTLIILPLFFSIIPAAAAQRYAKGGVLVVLSKSGLNIREKADVRAKVLALAPCGALVTMEGEPAAVTQTVEGIAGRWTKVDYNGITGFAFDGFLGRMSAPEQGCESLEAYFNDQFKSAGSPVEKVQTGEGTEEKITEMTFSNGAMIIHRQIISHGGGFDRTVSTYTLPGIERIEEVFLVLRLLGYIEPGFAFPLKSGRAGFAKGGSSVDVTVTRKNGECRYLDLTFRAPDFSGQNEGGPDPQKIVLRREGDGITIELTNLER